MNTNISTEVTTTFTNILAETEGGIMTIIVNRPDKLNALNHLTIQEIGKAVGNAMNDRAVNGIIITGAGEKAFVAGADISEFSNYGPQEAEKLSLDGQKVFREIEMCSKPVVAAVNGFALGGGCELAMSCHLRIASENAKFGQPEVKLGLIPGYGGTQRMIQLIGKGKAMEYLMTSDMIDAKTALELGLVNYVTTKETLIEKCKELINKISAVSPEAVGGIVKCVDAYFTKGVDGFRFEAEEFGKCFTKDDSKEGISAFLQKRPPNWNRS